MPIYDNTYTGSNGAHLRLQAYRGCQCPSMMAGIKVVSVPIYDSRYTGGYLSLSQISPIYVWGARAALTEASSSPGLGSSVGGGGISRSRREAIPPRTERKRSGLTSEGSEFTLFGKERLITRCCLRLYCSCYSDSIV